MIDTRRMDGPELFVAGPSIIVRIPVEDPALGAKVVRDAEDVKRHVAHWSAEGVHAIKVHRPIQASNGRSFDPQKVLAEIKGKYGLR